MSNNRIPKSQTHFHRNDETYSTSMDPDLTGNPGGNDAGSSE